jgi:hypothetical protein
MLSRGAFHTLHPLDVLAALSRHNAHDWGDVCAEVRQANDDALAHGGRLLSVYHDHNGVKFWIITEADRSLTTVLLIEDY